MPLIAQANHHEATANPHDVGPLFDAVGNEQHLLVGSELLRCLGLQLTQAQGEHLPDHFEVLKGRSFAQKGHSVL
jgi:hypothetical protein